MRKYKWVCERCGHDELTAEGTAWWSQTNQVWVFEWHETFCPECGDLVYVKQEYLPPEMPLNVQLI